jgi:hypothetical protein
MIAHHHVVHAKTAQGGGQATLGDPLGLHGLEEVLKDPVRLARLQATRPSPSWANQTEAEHDADVAGAWRSRTTANRRILQGVEEDDDGAIMHLLPGPTAWCDDPLATNMDEGGHCMYDCVMLQRHYFPAEESRCYRYDGATGGWPDALLAWKQVWSDSNNTIVVPTDENGIIQGALGPDGVPVKLDARISSGSAVDFSEASIVVRHVRFSGQSAPLDPHVAARTYTQGYMHNPYFGGDETRNGGAFSYDGGGLDPEVRTPKLVFEHVVFDRNRAVSYAAIFICGRAHTMSSLELVVDGCMFFRNAATYVGGALYVMNVMPGTHLVNNTEFLHNTGFVSMVALFAGLDTKVGVQGRRSTSTIANSHNDAGGAWTYQTPGMTMGTMFATTADGTIFEALFERVTAVDMNSAAPYAFHCNSNGLQETHCVQRECRIARVVGVEDALQTEFTHSVAVAILSPTTAEISRLTLQASGSFIDQSRGNGVLLFNDAHALTAFPPNTEYRVVDSKFVNNQAAYGGAIAILCEDVQVVVQRCFFEVRAHKLRL